MKKLALCVISFFLHGRVDLMPLMRSVSLNAIVDPRRRLLNVHATYPEW